MGDKYELFRVTISAVGFRNHRDCEYRLDTVIHGHRQSFYFEKYTQLVKFIQHF